MTKLKPCPFCGGSDTEIDFVFIGKREYVKYRVKCNACKSRGALPDTREQAIRAWNTRADGWISVADQLPPATHDPNCLLLTDEDEVIIAWWASGHWESNDKITIHYGDIYEEEIFPLGSPSADKYKIIFTHWMPLPESPEER